MNVRESVPQRDWRSTILKSRNIDGDLHDFSAAGLQLALRKRVASSNYILEHQKETKKPQTSRQETSWKAVNLGKYSAERRLLFQNNVERKRVFNLVRSVTF